MSGKNVVLKKLGEPRIGRLTIAATPHMPNQEVADMQCFLNTLVDGCVEGVTPQDPKCVN